MTVLVLPVIFVFTALTVLVFAFGARRLLGLRFSFLRTLIAGVLAFLIASPIITAISGSVVAKRTSVLPELWFVILGVTIALVVGMVFLVVAEALVPSGSVPGLVYMLRGMRRRMGRARRYWQISGILVRRGLMPYVRGGRRSELSTSEGRARLARSVRLAMEDGGVTFVKLGQVLSTRRDLLPAEFISELSRLQDDAAEVPWPRIEQVLRSELGAEVGELFASFDREPIAAASIAQVHAATLPSGARVVVKVRQPDVSQIVDRDLDIAGRLAARLERSTSWGRAVGTAGLAAGFAAALREELDLRVEARNMTSVAAAPGSRGSGGIAIPVPYQPLCTGLVLVMERFDGRPLAAIDAGMPADVRAALARSLLDCLLREVMLEGTFHADPHPGNVLLLADGRLGLLDFGSVGRIDQGLRSALQRMWLPALAGALIGGRVDVTVTCGLLPAPEGIASEVFCAEPLLVGLRPDHRLAGQDTIALQDLAYDILGIAPMELFPAWALSQQQALDQAGINPPTAGLVDTDLAATRWVDQPDVDWILLIPSLAAAHTKTVVRPVTSGQLVPFTLQWNPNRAHTTAVARFVHAALTAELPPGWRTQPDHLHHRE